MPGPRFGLGVKRERFSMPFLYFALIGALLGAAVAYFDPVLSGVAFVGSVVIFIFSVRIDLCVLFLLLVRSSIDFSTDYALISLGPAARLNVAAVLNVLLLASGMIHLAVNRRPIANLPGIRFLTVFLVASLMSCSRTPSLATAMADWLRNLGCVVLYAVVATSVLDRQRPETIVKVILLSALVPLSIGFWQKGMGIGFYTPPAYERIYATFFHPNPYGLYLSFIMVFAYSILHAQGRMSAKLSLLLLMALSAISLVLTYSRGAWIALLASLIVVAALTRWRSAVASLAAIGLGVALLPHFVQRFADVTGVARSGSFWWRVDLWRKMITLVGSHAFLGHGIGSFYFFSKGWAAHNDYLRLAFETGLIGLASYLGGLLAIGFFVFKRLRQGELGRQVLSVAFLGTLAGFLVASAVENVVMMPVLQWYFWGLAGLVVGLIRREARTAALAYA